MKRGFAPPAGLEPATLPAKGRDALTNWHKTKIGQRLLTYFAPPAGLEPATL